MTRKGVRGQDGRALPRRNGSADIVQAGRAEPPVELDHVVAGLDVAPVESVERIRCSW